MFRPYLILIRGYCGGTVMPYDAVKFVEMLERVGGDHGRVLVCGFGGNLFVRTSLVNFYASCGGVWDARRVFEEMGKRSLVTWNTLLAGYVKCGDIDGARRVFGEMP
ncbi:pentatricopeptide repeat-containing protein, partial [Tanacetum coccineum]